jgi:hypothetical protein
VVGASPWRLLAERVPRPLPSSFGCRARQRWTRGLGQCFVGRVRDMSLAGCGLLCCRGLLGRRGLLGDWRLRRSRHHRGLPRSGLRYPSLRHCRFRCRRFRRCRLNCGRFRRRRLRRRRLCRYRFLGGGLGGCRRCARSAFRRRAGWGARHDSLPGWSCTVPSLFAVASPRYPGVSLSGRSAPHVSSIRQRKSSNTRVTHASRIERTSPSRTGHIRQGEIAWKSV